MIDKEVMEEVERAMKKFPRWPKDPIHAVAIIAEELGELQKAVLEAVYEPHKCKDGNIDEEATQLAAMVHRFRLSLNHGSGYEWSESKAKQRSQRDLHRDYLQSLTTELTETAEQGETT